MAERLEHGQFELAGGLHDDECGTESGQLPGELVDGGAVTRNTPCFGGFVNGDFKKIATDIDSDMAGSSRYLFSQENSSF
jgi:hypothetical protein